MQAPQARHVDVGQNRVSALLSVPPRARALLILAHGAGAGMRHRFFEALIPELDARSLATFRFQFPYMEAGRRRPDGRRTLLRTVRAAIAEARDQAPALPVFAGGKSMGGRMTSLAMAEAPIADVNGLVFLGFPLHPAGRTSTERATHLESVRVPMLFLQGSRDRLADLELLCPTCQALGPRATLHVLQGADHGFEVRKRDPRTTEDVRLELADTLKRWVDQQLGS